MPDIDHTVTIYMREIGTTPLLSREEEVKLAKRIKKKDAAARDLMIRANLRLVVKIARDYASYGLPLLDLISEGNIGLMKAVERFDPKKGGKLSTYAAWWIKQAIKRALANQSKTIRLPAHMVDKIARLRRAEHELTEHLNRAPTNEELAARLDVSAADVETWKTVALRPASLDAPLSDDGGSISQLVSDDRAQTPYEELNDKQLQTEMEECLEHLDARERDILKYRYGLGGVEAETLEQVGERFSITRERVRQIQNSAVKKLRSMMDGSPDKDAEAEA